jgi:hypothetical protein
MKHTKASDSKTSKGLGSRINYHEQNKLTVQHLKAGSIIGKIPIPLSDGKTVVFAKCQEDVEKVKAFWEKKIKRIT